jgi:hypothetical protein
VPTAKPLGIGDAPRSLPQQSRLLDQWSVAAMHQNSWPY